VCGGPEARTIVKKMADACGDDFELKEYERFSPLVIASNGSLTQDPTKTGAYKHVQPGDCVVAFSRNDIFAIKREIEKTTPYRCCVIYGKLPPQTRADQARRFNDPDSGYDILVASDAIGMGLNLNIRRIIFNTIFKYNGEEVVRLSHSEIKQISGRAGRRNSPYPNGEVTCRDPRDLPYIRKCLFSEITQIEKAALLPTSEHIELFSEGLQDYDVVGEDDTDLHKILRQFSAMATVKGDFFLGRQTEMQTIAKSLKGVPLSLKDAYTMCLSPTSEHSLYLLLNFAWKLARGQVCGLPSRTVPKAAKSFDDLSYLCNVYGDADLFLWLQFKFPPSNAVEHQAALARKETTLEFINQALANTDRLDLNHDYIRMALRNRANWESDNGSFEDTNDDSDHFGDSSSTTSTRRKDSGGGRRTFDGEDDDDDDAYASFSERRQAHG
jgi:ATP-dependent RNA helicase SUPV3L1/SUV3